MKDSKFMAFLKLVLLVVIAGVMGYFIMQPAEITYNVKKAKEVTEEIDEESNEEEVAAQEEATVEDEDENEDSEEVETKSFHNYLSYENISLGLDLAGGVSVVYEADADAQPSSSDMSSAEELLRKRLTFKGHTEAEVSGQGETKIRVEMPGVDDPQQAIAEIGQTAELKFYGVRSDNYYAAPIGEMSYVLVDQNSTQDNMKLYDGSNIDEIGTLLLTGERIANAYASSQQVNSKVGGSEPVVVLEFDAEGTELFANGTHDYLNNYIAIALDTNLISVPNVSVEIVSGEAIITGMSSLEEAKSLANLINSGSLPFKLNAVETNIIGARLGQDALSTSIRAGIIGLIVVGIYMICVYFFPGFIADLALVVYTILIVAVLALFNITLTLPGIAGIILSIGMAVDANVIIFSRIREELSMGKTLNSAIDSGFSKAMSAIVDGNVTTLIIAAILYAEGIGSIRGFAQTLALGIITSMFTALVITKFILNIFVKFGCTNLKIYGVNKKAEVTTAELNKKHGKKE
ncbi:MAG: protein translocase subunit SecD [Clostridia bacterium]|nr:protein translocase subunit SecD [Clostridia bacterium]